MTWTKLSASRDVQRHRTSKKELDDIRALIARDLADASVTALSADRRFATAYNAALLTTHGDCLRRIPRNRQDRTSQGVVFRRHHACARCRCGKYADYFESCRRKRNVIDSRFAELSEVKFFRLRRCAASADKEGGSHNEGPDAESPRAAARTQV